jgi:hypothetical protein
MSRAEDASSRPMTRVWDEFLRYAKSHPGVAFMRKDDIAKFVRSSPLTVRENETI